MAVTMALFWVSLVLSVIGASADGEFSILYSPDSLKFTGSSKISESLIKEAFSASLGLSVEENSKWSGLYVIDPFNTPEAVVEVYVDGVSNLGHNAAKTYPIRVDEYMPDTFNAMSHRIQQRFTTGGNKLVNVQLSDPNELYEDVFGDITIPKASKQTYMYLKNKIEEDAQFLQELELLKTYIKKIESGAISPDNIVDFYNFRFTSLHILSDLHGSKAAQTIEAKKLLGEALQDLSKAFVKAYDGSVLVTVVATNVAHTRTIRAAEDTPAAATQEEVDDSYDADYPAIFNILLWFGIVFTFTLIAIVYAIMDMDPGRDSIIYRMTSTRMKKDN